MEKKYLLDTNILIYYLDNNIPENSLEAIKKVFQHSFNISITTRCELLGCKGYDDNAFNKVMEFLDYANVIDLDKDIADIAIGNMRKFGVDLADSIIAATVLHNDLILMTRNEKDFKRVGNLNIYNPFSDFFHNVL